jgi:hypothetical protein
MMRRKFVISAIASVASFALLGCVVTGGGSSTDALPSPQSAAVVWDPAPLLFMAGRISTYDLSKTLPPGIARGGVFGLAPNSSPLPPGLTLSPDGILSASGPPVSVTSNVIFTYREP